jgi:hypothetical protein
MGGTNQTVPVLQLPRIRQTKAGSTVTALLTPEQRVQCACVLLTNHSWTPAQIESALDTITAIETSVLVRIARERHGNNP